MALRRVIPFFLLLCFSFYPLVAETPDRDLAKGRQLIAEGKFESAVGALDSALRGTEALPPETQVQARTAIHFYTAVAYSGLARDEEALLHLSQVLRLSPEISSVDPGKYGDRFVELFARARIEADQFSSFRKLYSVSGTASSTSQGPTLWGRTPALEIIGTAEERREWGSITEADRESFMTEFWRLRDPRPETEKNEFRDAFEQRVFFADSVFGTMHERGAFTDRGRVFVLLGEPAHVRRKPIDSKDRIQAFNRGSIGIEVGYIEYWFYSREQLPFDLSKQTVTYQFVSHQGIGDYVLQKDGIALNVLALAAEASVKD